MARFSTPFKIHAYQTHRTNVPAIAMSFSDLPFAYGPFVPHHVPKQYVEGYFSAHRLDSKEQLSLNTTVEEVSFQWGEDGEEGWRLVLRKFEAGRGVDVWWEERFDAVVLANGHYSVPYVRPPSLSTLHHPKLLFIMHFRK